MTSSRENAISRLMKLSSDRIPIVLTFSDGNENPFNSARVSGYMEFNNDTITCKSDPTLPPVCGFSLSISSAVAFKTFTFEEAIKEEFGVEFKDLPPDQRGRLWAQKFQDAAVKIAFLSGAHCEIRSAPFA